MGYPLRFLLEVDFLDSCEGDEVIDTHALAVTFRQELARVGNLWPAGPHHVRVLDVREHVPDLDADLREAEEPYERKRLAFISRQGDSPLEDV